MLYEIPRSQEKIYIFLINSSIILVMFKYLLNLAFGTIEKLIAFFETLLFLYFVINTNHSITYWFLACFTFE